MTTSPFQNHLSDPTKLFSLVAGISLASAMAYQIGYLAEIDFRLAAMFTFTDALVSALAAIPIVVGAVPSLWRLVATAITPFDNSLKPRTAKKLLTVLVICAGLVAVFVNEHIGLWLVMSAAMLVALWKTDTSHLSSTATNLFRLSAIAFVALFGLYSLGGFVAARDLESTDLNYNLTIKGQSPRRVHLLKIGESVAIIKEADGSVDIIPRSEIVNLKRAAKKTGALINLNEFWDWVTGLPFLNK